MAALNKEEEETTNVRIESQLRKSGASVIRDSRSGASRAEKKFQRWL